MQKPGGGISLHSKEMHVMSVISFEMSRPYEMVDIPCKAAVLSSLSLTQNTGQSILAAPSYALACLKAWALQ